MFTSTLTKGPRPSRLRLRFGESTMVPCASGTRPVTTVAVATGKIPSARASARSASAPATAACLIATSSLRADTSESAEGRSRGLQGNGAANTTARTEIMVQWVAAGAGAAYTLASAQTQSMSLLLIGDERARRL